MSRSCLRSRNRLAAVVASVVLACTCAAQQASTGADYASITLSMQAQLGPQISLRLSVTELVFDLQDRNSDTAPHCVSGPSTNDLELPGVGLKRPLVAAAGVSYSASSGAFAVSGTPVDPGAFGQGDARQVCFQSFRLGTFSNVPGWVVTVDRVAEAGSRPINTLYIGAACGAAAYSGFHVLHEGDSTTLMSQPTSTSCQDLLVLVGLKPSREASGTSATRLRYSIIAPITDFVSAQLP